jgi:urease accessory protein UreF
MLTVAVLADEAETTPLDDIGGYAILADHASILHETLETRIYRT